MSSGRRLFRALVGLLVLLLGAGALGVAWLVGTDAGRARLLASALPMASALFDGRATIVARRLVSVRPADLRLEDVELRDTSGVPIARVARVRGALDLRALRRGVIRLPALELDSLRLDLRQDSVGPFNLQWVLVGDTTVPRPPAPPGLGRDVRIDRLQLRHVTVDVRYPWVPHPLFATAAERDSVTALRDSLHDLARVGSGFVERRVVAIAALHARDVRLVTPDDAPGALRIDSASFDLSDPPVAVRDLRGVVRWFDDSLTVDAPAVRLPASALVARGVLDWRTPGPLRYDVAIDAPDVALDDVNWTWPVLPREGRARGTVRVRTLDNPDHLEVTLRGLEATAMDSRVTGELTMVAEVRDFLLRDVALAVSPMTTQLASRLTEGLLPDALAGRFTGRFVAREGGSLRALRIDTLRLAYEDATVAGARSRLAARGTVSLGPAPRARDVRLDELTVDLRSAARLAPTWPTGLAGRLTMSGAVVDASPDAADLRALAVRWTDAAGRTSTATGEVSARQLGGTPRVALALAIDTLSLDALAAVDTSLPLRGRLAATVAAAGPLDSLGVTVQVRRLDEAAGALALDGRVGLARRAGDGGPWHLGATLRADSLDVRPWWPAGGLPSTLLAGAVRIDAAGQGARVDTARVDAALRQLPSERHLPLALHALGTWGAEALRVDSLLAEAPGVRVEASGGLARDSLARESFRASVRIDSLAMVRPELPRLAATLDVVDTALAGTVRGWAADSLSGDLNLSVYGEGAFDRYLVSVAVAGQRLRVGDIAAARVFGSVRADDLPRRARFVAAATADSIDGIAALEIATANVRIDDATPAAGALGFELLARDTSRLRGRGRFARGADTLLVRVDSLRFTYGDIAWANRGPLALRNRPDGFAIDSFAFTSNRGGSLRLAASVPYGAPIDGFLRLDAFPAGELTALALGTNRLPGVLSGAVDLSGRREDPRLRARLVVDSVGTPAVALSGVRVEAEYAERRLAARVAVTDTAGRSLRGEVTLPADLRLQAVDGARLVAEALSGSIVADSLRLRDLPLRVAGVRELDGLVHGRFALGGTFEAPDISGRLQLEDGRLVSEVLGIRPVDAALDLVAGGDSLAVTRFRFRSGARPSDTLHLTAAVRRPLRDDPRLALRAYLDNVALARRRDGTAVDLSGRLELAGPLRRPTLTGALFVPYANVVLDLTESRTVLDLQSAEASALLAPEERAIANGTPSAFGSLGEYLEARDVRVRLGDEVWVRTREASVQLAGEMTVREAAGRRLSLDGEVEAARGTYRLDLGVVNRPFVIQSGRVRFFPQDALNPTLDIRARHVVRGVDGRDVNVDVAIGGTFQAPTLRLGSPDDAYAGAPETEFISLLVFGAPTFALDGQRQQTVRAVTGVLLPSLSGRVEGTLQRLLPVFNTVQVSTAGGQAGEELGTFSSFLDNLSVTAGKQIGRRTYLRLDTGVCRGLASGAARNALNLWYGIAAEYRIGPGLTGQVGLDPGPSPCGTRLGGGAPRMQVGFDLFKEWVF